MRQENLFIGAPILSLQTMLALLARGRTIGYVADELVIAQNTAKGYVKNVYAKLGIHSRQELIDAVEELYLRM